MATGKVRSNSQQIVSFVWVPFAGPLINYDHSACMVDHFVAKLHKSTKTALLTNRWGQNMAISTISLCTGDQGIIRLPNYKVGTKCGHFNNQPVWGTIWWPSCKVWPKYGNFKNLEQDLHFPPVSLYRGTIWSTTDNVGAEIALFTSQHV